MGAQQSVSCFCSLAIFSTCILLNLLSLKFSRLSSQRQWAAFKFYWQQAMTTSLLLPLIATENVNILAGSHCHRQGSLSRRHPWPSLGQLCSSISMEPGAELSPWDRAWCWSSTQCAWRTPLYQHTVPLTQFIKSLYTYTSQQCWW